MTVAEGVGYVAVATLLAARRVADDVLLGSRLFTAWWAGIGANKVLAGLAGIGATLGYVDGSVYVSVLYLNFVVLAASLWCLLAYFAFLYTGRTRAFGPLAALCAGFFVMLTYNLTASHPTGVGFGTWRTFHTSEFPTPPLRGLLVLALLVVLPAAPALAHLRLLSRLTDRAQKYRVVLVSCGIVLWTTSVFFVSFPGFDKSPALQILSRLVGALGALASLWAYRPPSWVRDRLGEGVRTSARA